MYEDPGLGSTWGAFDLIVRIVSWNATGEEKTLLGLITEGWAKVAR